MMDTEKRLRALCEIHSVTGFESAAAGKLADMFRALSDDVYIDAFHNVIALKRGCGEDPKTVLVTAHYDEIGLVVTGISEDGFLSFTGAGGVDAKAVVAHEVTVHGREDLYGVIGAKAPHLVTDEEMKKAIPMKEMRIDIGLSGEAARKMVRVGDPVSLRAPLVSLKNGRVAGKTLDNKAGVAALLEILEELGRIRHEDHVVVAATVQEETSQRGVVAAAWHLEPDLGIVIDVCHGDMPEAPADESYPLGKGPAVAVGPILSRSHAKAVIAMARRERIPLQIDPEWGDTGTEAAGMAVSRTGVPTILFSIPVRYMHTTVETMSLDDLTATGRLAARYIAFRGETGGNGNG